MSRRAKALSGQQLMAKWRMDEYDLSYVILKHDLTVLDPPKIPILKKFLRSRHVRTDSEKFLGIIMNDPCSLRQKLFLLDEIEKIPGLPSKHKEELEPSARYSGEDCCSFDVELRSSEEDDSEPSARARYLRKIDPARARTLPEATKRAIGITEESILKNAIEDHENEIKGTPNVFSLIGKV